MITVVFSHQGCGPTTILNTTPAKSEPPNTERVDLEVKSKHMLPTGGPPQAIPVVPSLKENKSFHTPLDQKCPRIQGICLNADEDSETLTNLKRDIIEILRSCEGNCLYFDRLKGTYYNRFGKRFLDCYPWTKGKKVLCDLLAGLDIIDLEQLILAPKGRTKFMMRLKEPHASQFMMRMSLKTSSELGPCIYEAGHQLEVFDSKVPSKSYTSLTGGKTSATVSSPDIARVLLVPSPLDFSDKSPSLPLLNTAASTEGKVDPLSVPVGINPEASQREGEKFGVAAGITNIITAPLPSSGEHVKI